MSLIELMLAYQEILRREGRTEALVFLQHTCEQALWSHIPDSFDDHGNFTDAYGSVMNVKVVEEKDQPVGKLNYAAQLALAKVEEVQRRPGTDYTHSNTRILADALDLLIRSGVFIDNTPKVLKCLSCKHDADKDSNYCSLHRRKRQS
jgi:hypothetical protein